MAQLINITSEALQATIRRLLPSQQGFGEDLQASNVITPIIDLTPSAEGSEVRADLQTALAHGSVTVIDTSDATDSLVSTPGFYRIFANVTQRTKVGTGDVYARFFINDGSSNKDLWKQLVPNISGGTDPEQVTSNDLDFTVFLAAGDTLKAQTTGANSHINGSLRQVATVTGELVNPSGFTPQ